MRGLETAPVVEEPAKDRRRGAVRRVGHDVERSSRETQIGGVDTRHGDPVTEAPFELSGAAGVKLDGDDSMPGVHERSGDGPGSRADVEDERPVRKRSLADQLASGPLIQLMPAPPRRRASHGGGRS